MQRLGFIICTLVIVLSATLTGFAQEVSSLPDEIIALFDYDQSAPPAIEEVGTETRDGATVKDIQYPSPVNGAPISAYLVLPEGDGPFPGVLDVHWYNRTAENANRTQFLDEAVILANEGVASLLVATMWSDPNWYTEGRTLRSDYDDAIQQVIELRAALDVLLAQPQVDPERIAFVGHDFGAMYGTLMGAVDGRPDAYVLIAGASDFNQWMLFGVDPNRPGLERYMTQMAELAPSRFVASIDAPVLFQFGTEDGFTPPEDVEAYFAAANDPKELLTYDSDHAMALPEIQADRLEFLRQHLGLVAE